MHLSMTSVSLLGFLCQSITLETQVARRVNEKAQGKNKEWVGFEHPITRQNGPVSQTLSTDSRHAHPN